MLYMLYILYMYMFYIPFHYVILHARVEMIFPDIIIIVRCRNVLYHVILHVLVEFVLNLYLLRHKWFKGMTL